MDEHACRDRLNFIFYSPYALFLPTDRCDGDDLYPTVTLDRRSDDAMTSERQGQDQSYYESVTGLASAADDRSDK